MTLSTAAEAGFAPARTRVPLLDVRGLVVEFETGRARPRLRAVDGVELSVAAGETVGLVGESGSGKTTIGRAVLGLVPVTDGAISFDGQDITHAGHRRRRQLSSDLQVVFQDPYSSLNPVRTIGQTLRESLRVHVQLSAAEASERVRAMLERVGLDADADRRYPSQFSGGQRQRIAIARALMARPRLVICDEPVSALDLSVQAQVLNLLRELQAELGLAYLFVAHDLAVVRHLSQRIIVLYRGRVMEHGDAAVVFDRPLHPYTQALLDAAPLPDPQQQRRRRAMRLRHGSASTAVPADACPFVARCPHAIDACGTHRPPLEATPAGSAVACIRWRELRARAHDM
jgi:oligopeptide/dipeptide ABC transporter ATP-binding protein